MPLVIGIDGGGTKTKCMLGDEFGNTLACAEAGPSNHLASAPGNCDLKTVMQDVIREVLCAAGVQSPQIHVVVYALAGVGLNRKSPTVWNAVNDLLPTDNILLETDSVAALVGGTTREFGVALISGTGSIAVGIDERGNRYRSAGWGHIIGDEGSGYDIARQALTAAARAFDGRGPHTILKELACKYFGLTSLDELRGIVGSMGKSQIAAFMPCVVEAADRDDAVSREILYNSGKELGLAAAAVIKQLKLSSPFPVVLCGGAFAAKKYLYPGIEEYVRAASAHAVIQDPLFPPVVGAYLQGMRHLGIEPDHKIIDRLAKVWKNERR